MSDRAPYSRVYWSIVDDPKFADIYDDDRRLATWLRLLILADQSYPASAGIPLGTNQKALAALVDAGLVDRGTGNRFRIHGLDAERAKRRPFIAGPAPALVLNGSSPGPAQRENRNGTQGLSRGKAETRQDEAQTPRAPDPADVYWNLTGRYPSEKTLGWVDDLSSRYGGIEVIKALGTAHLKDRNTATLLGRTSDLLAAEARSLSLKAQEAERRRLKERRASPREVVDPAELQAEIEKILRGEAA